MNLEIGKRKLIDITQDELIQICIIEKVIGSLEYWRAPIVTDFDNKMFPDTIVIDYHSLRIDDGLKGDTLVFYFNHQDFRFHYRKEDRNETQGSDRLNIQSIKYLISKGFDVPIY